MRLDVAARRWFPGFTLGLLATAAYFQAIGTGHLLAAAMMPAAPPVEAPMAPPRSDEARVKSAAAVVERNPFDSVTGPLDGRPAPRSPTGEAALNQDPYADALCPGAKVLAIVASDDAPWSFAAIASPRGPAVLRRRGDAIEGWTVAFVGDWRPEERRQGDRRDVWDRVWLTDGATRCQMQLGREAAMDAPKPPHPAPPPGGTGKLPPDIAAGIRRISATEIEVDRGVIGRILERQDELLKARAVPEKGGLRIHGVRPGTLLQVLGVESGDLLRSVNGLDVMDPNAMLALYSRLTTASHFAVALDRKGRPMQVDVRIQ